MREEGRRPLAMAREEEEAVGLDLVEDGLIDRLAV